MGVHASVDTFGTCAGLLVMPIFIYYFLYPYLVGLNTLKQEFCYISKDDFFVGQPVVIQWWPPAPATVKNLNMSFKCCSRCSRYKSRDSFEIFSSWGFQNTPNMLELIEFWRRYLRSKTNDVILKNPVNW